MNILYFNIEVEPQTVNELGSRVLAVEDISWIEEDTTRGQVQHNTNQTPKSDMELERMLNGFMSAIKRADRCVGYLYTYDLAVLLTNIRRILGQESGRSL